ncbi:hypothetical protein HZC33_00890 [Candidatus Wolfebacteria bacterium]|nr:hypothetical protein [Candidatus Wolfebacteria bacterium]
MEKNFVKIYADFLNNFLNPLKKLKVVFDCSNGTTGIILKKLKNKNLELKIINNNPDGNFPTHGPNHLANGAMDQLKKEILKQSADLGVIFDADGDRAFFIDNRGRFIDPDIISRLLIWRLKPKKIVIETTAGNLLRNLNQGLKIYESKVGHFYIKKLMQKIKADFGCERSGHYYFKNFFYADSGILAAVEIINAVSKLPYSLADFIDLLPQYYRSKEINFRIENKNPRKILEKIENEFKNQAIKISRLDGLTMEFNPPSGRWRFNLRVSNTEPLLRLNIEADDKKILAKNYLLLRQSLSEFQFRA